MYVTDHAIVRYAERFLGLDVEQLRARITSRIPAGATLGVFPLPEEKMVARVCNGVVVTITPDRREEKKAKLKAILRRKSKLKKRQSMQDSD